MGGIRLSLRVRIVKSALLLGSVLLLAGCGYPSCQVVVVNEMPSAGMAQWYEVELVRRVQLADTPDSNNGSWQIKIQDVRSLTRDVVQAADGHPLSKHFVDFYVQGPRSSSTEGRCYKGFDECIEKMLAKLPKQCLM